ncbi:MAG: septal ring lytic transglycosylase RlpA family protein [Treponemataceae bacterium]|nr:septal ring lytic transglycosylase RlpA family protein [Treponemataceae bacterium]
MRTPTYCRKKVLFLLVIIGISGINSKVPILSAQQRSEQGIFSQRGLASWYGAEFEGKPTASGEIFQSSLFTAAHRSLPFGTYLKVTNLNNGKSVVVRVNDRGPFVENRIIDLSRAAASVLDMIHQGTTEVLIESIAGEEATQLFGVSVSQQKGLTTSTSEKVIPGTGGPEKGSTSSLQTTPINRELSSSANKSPSTSPTYRIQIGSFRVMKNALSLYTDLKNKGFSVAYEEYQGLYRIVLPRIPPSQLEEIKKQLANYGFTNILIREEISD